MYRPNFVPAGESYENELISIEMESKELEAIGQISGYVDANAYLHDERSLFVDVDLRDIVGAIETTPLSHLRYTHNAKELFKYNQMYEWLQSNRTRDIPSVIFSAHETVMIAPLKGCMFSREGTALCATLLFDLTRQPLKGLPLRIRRLCSNIKVILFPTFPDGYPIPVKPKLPDSVILRFDRSPKIKLIQGHDYDAEIEEAEEKARRPSLFSLMPRASFSSKRDKRKSSAAGDLTMT